MSTTKSRPTKGQMQLLVELLSLDPQLNASKFSANFTHKIAQKRWEAIASQLNALPGAEKNWEKWKKAWQDTKVTAKNKAAALKRHRNGTGGGPPSTIIMSDAQTDALSLISGVAISGHTNSKESMVEMVYDTSLTHDSCQLDAENIFVTYENEHLDHIDVIDETPTGDTTLSDILIQPGEHHSIQIPSTSITNINAVRTKTIDLQSKGYSQSIKRKSTGYTQPMKKSSSTLRLHESNLAAKKLGDIATQKLELKKEYYAKKLKIMEEQVSVLKNVGTLFSTFINSKDTTLI